MTYNFGDSFDLYAAPADMANGYWDSGANVANWTLAAGRFSGSRGITFNAASNLVKSSAVNDAVHHLVVSFQQTSVLTGTNLGGYIQLLDGTTAQCSIVFRSDGAILLTSGGPAGTVLATYTGAFLSATWYGFEFEVVINNTTGSFSVRKNGNSVNDFTATALNTRGGTTNNYANKLTLAMQTNVSGHIADDLFWQSGAATGTWLGDIRCYTRMPASDQAVQFSKSPTSVTQTPFVAGTSMDVSSGGSYYAPITATADGSISAITVTIFAGFTGNLKCSVFNDNANTPGTIRSSATTFNNPTTGNITFTFPTPFAVVRGVQYWLGLAADGHYLNALMVTSSGSAGKQSSAVAYSAFPTANPTILGGNNAPIFSWSFTVSDNNCLVNEPQQDGLTTYVYDSTPGDADFYGLGGTSGTPAYVVATTIRGYAIKPDAGTRVLGIQLKSGTTTVATPGLALSSSYFQWAWRTDVNDPNTGASWASSSVNVAQIGPTVVA
jgi:hypothetical protein